MKTTPNQRLKQFRLAAELETGDLYEITGISKSLIEKMESGGVAVSEKTAKTLKEKCKLSPEWLLNGHGEMKFELTPVNPYRDYALKRLEGEVQFLRDMLKSFALNKQNFRIPLNGTAHHKKYRLAS